MGKFQLHITSGKVDKKVQGEHCVAKCDLENKQQYKCCKVD